MVYISVLGKQQVHRYCVIMFKQLCVQVINTTQTVDTYDEQARRPGAKIPVPL